MKGRLTISLEDYEAFKKELDYYKKLSEDLREVIKQTDTEWDYTKIVNKLLKKLHEDKVEFTSATNGECVLASLFVFYPNTNRATYKLQVNIDIINQGKVYEPVNIKMALPGSS